MGPKYHGQGIATDACKTLLKWAREQFNIHKMLVAVFEGNGGSTKVLENVGFKYRQTLKGHMEVRGSLRTAVVYDWRRD
jgi:RimJ/RimL family protein N-acetyltransferase